MTPPELQRALAQMPSRSAQTLVLSCIEGRSPAECAALYGVDLPQWEILFFEAARALVADVKPLPDADRRRLATALQEQLRFDPSLVTLAPAAAIHALITHREEVHQLTVEAERAAAASPARAREGWLRRVAVVVIVAVSFFVWLRERNKAPEPTPSHNPLPPRKVG